MEVFGTILTSILKTGPYAGWVLFAGLTLWLLRAYATDKIISSGRHQERSAQMDELRRDRDYWRDKFGETLKMLGVTLTQTEPVREELKPEKDESDDGPHRGWIWDG